MHCHIVGMQISRIIIRKVIISFPNMLNLYSFERSKQLFQAGTKSLARSCRPAQVQISFALFKLFIVFLKNMLILRQI